MKVRQYHTRTHLLHVLKGYFTVALIKKSFVIRDENVVAHNLATFTKSIDDYAC